MLGNILFSIHSHRAWLLLQELSCRIFICQITRMRVDAAGRGEEAVPERIVETPARGRGRARLREKGRARGAAPAKVHVRGVSLESEVDATGDQSPPEYAAASLLQDTFLRVLGVLESFT